MTSFIKDFCPIIIERNEILYLFIFSTFKGRDVQVTKQIFIIFQLLQNTNKFFEQFKIFFSSKRIELDVLIFDKHGAV